MIRKRALFATVSTALVLAAAGNAETIAPEQLDGAADLSRRLAAIERVVERKRRELKVPGLALVIVRDDEVIYQKGLGTLTRNGDEPITPRTLFPIASVSKQFTAIALLMSAEKGLLSLDDSPRKYLPYFRMRDPDAEPRLTIRHLLAHTSGLPRLDSAWGFGILSRHDVIRITARAVPKANPGERYEYNNGMYAAAGEVLGIVHGTSWEQAITEQLFKPLGMNATVASTKPVRSGANVPSGYRRFVLPGLAPTIIPIYTPDATNLGAAGAISSNAEDMGRWVRFLLARGDIDGIQLASPKVFDEAFESRVEVIPKRFYGLGWEIYHLKGYKIVQHAGNLIGFQAFVLLVPELRLGFAMLANVVYSPELPSTIATQLWNNFVVPKKRPIAAQPTR